MSDDQAEKKIVEMMFRCSFATGHGDTIDDLLSEMEWQIKELKARAALASPPPTQADGGSNG